VLFYLFVEHPSRPGPRRLLQAACHWRVDGVPRAEEIRLRLVTSQGPPYASRSPRAHPSGWTRTQGLSRGIKLVCVDTLGACVFQRGKRYCCD
jgi:hypothetical protein